MACHCFSTSSVRAGLEQKPEHKVLQETHLSLKSVCLSFCYTTLANILFLFDGVNWPLFHCSKFHLGQAWYYTGADLEETYTSAITLTSQNPVNVSPQDTHTHTHTQCHYSRSPVPLLWGCHRVKFSGRLFSLYISMMALLLLVILNPPLYRRHHSVYFRPVLGHCAI